MRAPFLVNSGGISAVMMGQQSVRRSRKRFCAERKSSTPRLKGRAVPLRMTHRGGEATEALRSVRGSPKMLAFLGVLIGMTI